MQNYSAKDLAQSIDHTLLKPEATSVQIRTLCEEALSHQFFGVCVNSSYVPLCTEILKGTSIRVVSVVGFPLGAMTSTAKAFETSAAVKAGAQEIDMVIHLGLLKDKSFNKVTEDIRQVVKAAEGKWVKVILETCLLTEEEKIAACQCSLEAGAQFVKTSTGFSTGGATMADVLLMKKTVGDKMQVKASGGIKSTQQAIDYLKAGVTRLGTSSGIALIQNVNPAGGY